MNLTKMKHKTRPKPKPSKDDPSGKYQGNKVVGSRIGQRKPKE